MLLLVMAALAVVLKTLWPTTLPYVPTRATTLFVVGVSYFGLFNSRLAEGQTLGKRLLGCRLVDVQGRCISLSRSILRSAVVGLPLLFVDLAWSLSAGTVYVGSTPPLIGLYLRWVAFALFVFILWFDKEGRDVHRSIYDLFVGTYVTKKDATAPFSAVSISWRRVGLAALSAAIFTGVLQERLWTPQASFTAVRQAAALEQRLRNDADMELREVYVTTDVYDEETAYVEVALTPTLHRASAQTTKRVAGAVLAVYPALGPRRDLEVRVGYREPLTQALARVHRKKQPVEV